MADSVHGQTPTPAVAGRLRGGALASVLASLMLTLFLAALDQTIVSTALKSILTDLDPVHGIERYTWPVTAYLLTSTAMIPVVGKLSDMFGRKVFLVPAVLIFLIGSALCGASVGVANLISGSDALWLFIAFRAVQGIGGGALLGLVFTTVGDIFTPAERARWQGLFFAVFGLASVIGPTAGGYITDNIGWEWVFYVNLPFGIAALFLLIFFLPSNISIRSATRSGFAGLKRVDWLGALTSTAAAIALILGLTWGGHNQPFGYPWNSPQVIGALSIAVVLFVAFVLIERFVAAEPIIPLDLFKNQVFSAGAVLAMLVGVTLFAVVFYLPPFIQIVMGQNATNSGVVITPLTLALVISGAVGGFLIARTGRYQWLSIMGSAIVVGGAFLLTTMTASTTMLTVSLFMVVLGIGLGMIQPVMTLAVQNAIPRARLGVGTSAVTYLRSLGQLLGVAIVGSVVNNNFSTYLAAHLPDGISKLPADAREKLTAPDILQTTIASQQGKDLMVHNALAQADQTVIPQAVKQAVDAAVTRATASVPPGPQHDAIVAQITKQVTEQVTVQATPAITAQVHQQVTDLFISLFAAAKDAFTSSVHQGFVVATLGSVALLVVTFFLKDVPLRTTHAHPEDAASGEPTPVAEPIGL